MWRLLLLASVVFAKEGFDGIQSVSTSTFTCLQQNDLTFFIARIWRSNGAVDSTGLQNIKNARSAGMTDVDGYVFPCVTCSASAASQIQSVVNHIKSTGAVVNYIWLDVEILSWSTSHTTNRQFITDMVDEVKKLGYKPAIYSNNNNWQSIVGLDWEPYPDLPLWWANYNNDPGFDKFVPFGGWTVPLIHQYHGTETGPCSVSMDRDYKA